MFVAVLTFIITVMHVYVFGRAGSVPLVVALVSKKYLFGFGAGLWAVLFLGRFFWHGRTGPLAALLEWVGMNWMGVLFLMSSILLIVDVFTGFGFLFSKYVPILRGLALAVGAAFSMIAFFQGLRPPVVRSYEVVVSGLPADMDGKVIVAVSDLHLGTLVGTNWLDSVITQVKAEKPDLVVLLGDIYEGHDAPSKEFIPIFRHLSAPLGVWVVLGNHEFYRRGGADLTWIQASGFKLLRNSWAQVRPGLNVAGVDFHSFYQVKTPAEDALAQALAGRPAGATILLSHAPEHAEEAARNGVGLMLSGHTHGGQIWPFGYLVRLQYSVVGGLYRVGEMSVIVCRGTATWGPRMRLWYPNEIIRVTMRRK